MGQLVNKQELAKCLGVSPTSISLWMLRYGDDFPAAERDPERRRYRFDPAEVAAFLRARQDQEAAGRAAAEAAHAALLASAPRLFAPSAAGADAEGSRLKVEMDAWRLRRLQREEAERIGALLPVEQVGALLCDVFSRLGRDLHASIRRIGR